MTVRGIRGATIVEENQAEAILSATRVLLDEILTANAQIKVDEIASVLFTMTEDLNAAYPAEAARQKGWDAVPLMCAREIAVPNSLERCIRVLLHWNTEVPQATVKHVYLGKAASLRPDLQAQSKET